jgi:hypothetical protein
MYNTRDLLVENNTFYDNYGTDFNFKDCGSPTSDRSSWEPIRSGTIFLPNQLLIQRWYKGINQDTPVANILVIRTYSIRKIWQYGFVFPPMTVYNNTFIDCNGGLGTWFDTPVKAYNNIFYNTSTNGSNQYVQLGGVSNGNVSMDYNLYYSTGGIQPNWVFGSTYSSFVAWQSGTGKDGSGVYTNPNFVNPTGSAAADFKRTSYPNDVSGSPYGPHAGAYITGNEIIGVGGSNYVTSKPFPTFQTNDSIRGIYLKLSLRCALQFT